MDDPPFSPNFRVGKTPIEGKEKEDKSQGNPQLAQDEGQDPKGKEKGEHPTEEEEAQAQAQADGGFGQGSMIHEVGKTPIEGKEKEEKSRGNPQLAQDEDQGPKEKEKGEHPTEEEEAQAQAQADGGFGQGSMIHEGFLTSHCRSLGKTPIEGKEKEEKSRGNPQLAQDEDQGPKEKEKGEHPTDEGEEAQAQADGGFRNLPKKMLLPLVIVLLVVDYMTASERVKDSWTALINFLRSVAGLNQECLDLRHSYDPLGERDGDVELKLVILRAVVLALVFLTFIVRCLRRWRWRQHRRRVATQRRP